MTKMDEAVSDGLVAVGVEYPGTGDIANFHRALRERGYAVLPVEPNEKMRQIGGEVNCPTITLTSACNYAVDVYRAMIAAAQEG